MSDALVSSCMTAAERSSLLEALSDRVVRHGSLDAWRHLFLGPAHETIRFETTKLTVLATDDPLDGAGRDDSTLLAERLGATAEPSRTTDLVLAFVRPSAALRAAIVMQRLAGRRKVRTALATAQYTIACFEIDGLQRRLVVGPELEWAEAALAKAAAGSIFVCAESYAILEDRLGDQVPSGLILTETQDDTVTQASITLAPQHSALSTFAGLGVS